MVHKTCTQRRLCSNFLLHLIEEPINQYKSNSPTTRETLSVCNRVELSNFQMDLTFVILMCPLNQGLVAERCGKSETGMLENLRKVKKGHVKTPCALITHVSHTPQST